MAPRSRRGRARRCRRRGGRAAAAGLWHDLDRPAQVGSEAGPARVLHAEHERVPPGRAGRAQRDDEGDWEATHDAARAARDAGFETVSVTGYRNLGIMALRIMDPETAEVAVAEGWHRGPTAKPVDDPEQVERVMRALLAKSRAPAGMDGQDLPGWEGR